MNESNQPNAKLLGIGITISIFSLVGLIILFMSGHVVEPTYKGLKISGGELQSESLSPGFYILAPFWQRIEDVYTGTVSTDEDKKGKFKEEVNPFRGIQPLSKDGQVIDIDVQLGYSIVNPVLFRETTGSSEPRTIEQLLLIPTIRKLVYDYASEYTWKGLIQEGDRQEFGRRVTQSIQFGEVTKRTCKEEQRVTDEKTGTETIIEAGCEVSVVDKISQPSDYGVSILTVNFKKIKPNQKIIAAVETAQAKEQEVKIAQQEAEIAKQEAQKAIEVKRGQTESQKLEAEADAYRVRVEKEEEAKGVIALAEAEKVRALALRASSELIDYKRLDIEMVLAEAQLEWARHPERKVPETITVIGTEEAEGLKVLMGIPNVAVQE